MHNRFEPGEHDAEVSYQGNPDNLDFGPGWEQTLRKNPEMQQHLPAQANEINSKPEYNFVANTDEDEKTYGNNVGSLALRKIAWQPTETEPPKE